MLKYDCFCSARQAALPKFKRLFKEKYFMHAEALGERDEKGFFSLLGEMAKEVLARDDFAVVHHYDADGITSGAITIKALTRAGKKVKSLCLKQLYKENIEEVRALGKNYLFVDFGSGQLDYLLREFGGNLFVIDHHQPSSGWVQRETVPGGTPLASQKEISSFKMAFYSFVFLLFIYFLIPHSICSHYRIISSITQAY